ncbi:MarR family winged helix-turn-helix transcriptional regulator [Bifidobacterium sp.]|uniref:MarR family winged helix-turn-helix transcriptional regulator n=1 Tax=Bifidobacterium sp. TaxID=41200 RepID=UPI0039E79E74
MEHAELEPSMIRELIDACWKARRITDLMPSLPPGMRPRHISILDAISIIGAGGPVRIGAVGEFLDVSMPGVTRMVNELTRMGYVSKSVSSTDGRGVNVVLTAKGEKCRSTYTDEYWSRIGRSIGEGISVQDCASTVSTIRELFEAVSKDSDRRNE